MRRKIHRLNELIRENHNLFLEFLYIKGLLIDHEYNNYDYSEIKLKNEIMIVYLIMNDRNPVNYNFVIMESIKSFNKISQCPFKRKIPKPNKFEIYYKRFMYWCSKEGIELASTLRYEFFEVDNCI